MGQSLDSSSD